MDMDHLKFMRYHNNYGNVCIDSNGSLSWHRSRPRPLSQAYTNKAFRSQYMLSRPVMHDSDSRIGIDFGISHIPTVIGISKIKLGWNWNRNRNHGFKPWNRNRNQRFRLVYFIPLELISYHVIMYLKWMVLSLSLCHFSYNNGGIGTGIGIKEFWLESEWNQGFIPGIEIGIRNLKNAGIGTGIKTCPESCITGPD